MDSQEVTSSAEVGRKALRAAIKVRRQVKVPDTDPICVYDVAERLGLEVRFLNASSLEGLYHKTGSGLILLPSRAYRPVGRLAFSCAHELGHHIFGHGTVMHEYMDEGSAKYGFAEEERLADLFANFLLMPRAAVRDSLSKRSIVVSKLTALQAFALSSQFGVGYSTFLNNLRFSQVISRSQLEQLQKSTPKSIREEVLGFSADGNVIVVDNFWEHVAIDLQIDDYAVLPIDAVLPANIRIEKKLNHQLIARAIAVGIGQLKIGEKQIFCRVSKKNYVGRSCFRHLEDPDLE